MKLITQHGFQERIIAAACPLDCSNIALAKRGKNSSETDEAVFEMMFIRHFAPFWSPTQLRQKECYLNEKYGI